MSILRVKLEIEDNKQYNFYNFISNESDIIDSSMNSQIQLYRVVQPITVKQEWHHFAQCSKQSNLHSFS